MPQISIHLPDVGDPNAAEEKRNLLANILSKHGLTSHETAPKTADQDLQAFHFVVAPDAQTAQKVVTELQSNGITAFIKPRTSAPM